MIQPPTLILQYSRLDRGVYQTTSRHPEIGDRIGTIPLHAQVGTSAPTWNGHVYCISLNALLRDYTIVGTLMWNNKVWDVGRYHGFAIDEQGTGWLMSTAEPDVPISFLLKVDLDTAQVTFVNEVWPGNYPDPVNGLVIAAVLDTPAAPVGPAPA